jgi:hypothetical protein
MEADVPTLPEYLEFMIADDENEEMSPYNPKWRVKKRIRVTSTISEDIMKFVQDYQRV